ncbi:hypothetical protein XF35_42750 [Streptomyces platensis subsp. clarensis]|nr:hypothetical protein [Streptomyces showdoensis]MCW7991733.1 hypothetical protein [Streptomyces platensis subsp. clarensis]
MDEQGGAGGVPQKPQGGVRDGEDRTAAADTDEASRLDRPEPRRDPVTGRRRWRSPKTARSERAGEDG